MGLELIDRSWRVRGILEDVWGTSDDARWWRVYYVSDSIPCLGAVLQADI